MFNHPFFIWLFAILFCVLGILFFCLVRWNKKLKTALDIQLALHDSSSFNTIKLEVAFKKTMNFNIVVFVVIAVVILGAVIFFYEYYETDESIITSVTETILLVVALFGGFSLGNIWRRYEANHFLSQLIGQTSQRERVERRISLSEDRLIKQQQTLATLSQNPNRQKQEANEIFKEYTEATANTLNVERVSIWLFDADSVNLDCVDFYTKSNNTHKLLPLVAASEIPNYFNELNKHRVIAVDDAMQNPATQELTDGYLQDNNIGAILDGGIWVDGKAVGVVCIEHVGGIRQWASDEKTFAGSIADLVRVTLETCKRRKAEQALLERSAQLEQMVQDRTQSLQESNQRFSYVMKHAPLLIFTIDQEAKLVDFNPAAELQLGYSLADAVGKDPIELFVTKESQQKARGALGRLLDGYETRGVELFLIRGDGKKVEFEFSGSLGAADSKTGLRKIVVIGQDITQKKALEHTLIKAREAAESADRIKSMFVASMSHELRTPLNSIIGFLGVVLQGISGTLNPAQKGQLDRAYESSKHLLLLISDVLDVSKIEAGFLQLNTGKFELKPLLTEAEHAVQHLLAGKKLALSIDCAAKLQLETDRKRLYQVVLNVLSNAVKYTKQGTVMLNAHIKNNILVITCQDTGIGINETDFARLFQPFVRIESPLKIKVPGTGLGLYLSQKILTQLLGGSITVQSELGQGSTFTIIMPIKTAAVVTPKVASSVESDTEETLL
jgi:PAS domain S-box-containing protein